MAKEDLRPLKLTHSEAIENGRKGGIASGEARRRKKDIRECLELLLEKEIKARNGESMSGAEAISAKLFEKALKGDIRAFEVLRDSAGQKPVDKVQVATVEQKTIDEIRAEMEKRRSANKE